MISVAIATYNGAKYIEALLKSLQNQTLSPDEIIVVDDSSTDNTIEILKSFQTVLPIQIFVNEKNLGVNLNFQKAVANCSGDVILICDQDDVWFPENIQTKVAQLEKLPQDKPVLVASTAILVDENLRKICDLSRAKDFSDWKDLIHTAFQGTTMAFNRRLLDFSSAWPKKFEGFPYDFFLYCVALMTGTVYGCSRPLMYYRSHANNKSFHSGKIKNFAKRLFPFHKVTLFILTVQRVDWFDYVLKSLPAKDVHPEVCEYVKFLDQCKKGSNIRWLLFLKNKSFPLSLKLKVLLESFFLRTKSFLGL